MRMTDWLLMENRVLYHSEKCTRKLTNELCYKNNNNNNNNIIHPYDTSLSTGYIIIIFKEIVFYNLGPIKRSLVFDESSKTCSFL